MKSLFVSLVLVVSLVNFAAIGAAQQLDEKTQQALIAALNDEYKAKATYQKVIDTFGEVRPFSNIIQAEQHHIEELLPLFTKYGIEVPKDDWYGKVPTFATLQEAYEAGVQAEIENAKMYDEFFKFVKEQDVLAVFKNLRDASQEKHLPAFERNAERSSEQGQGNRNGQGQGKAQGQGNRNGQGQGKGQGRGNK
jgi:hypothetical protein